MKYTNSKDGKGQLQIEIEKKLTRTDLRNYTTEMINFITENNKN